MTLAATRVETFGLWQHETSGPCPVGGNGKTQLSEILLVIEQFLLRAQANCTLTAL